MATAQTTQSAQSIRNGPRLRGFADRLTRTVLRSAEADEGEGRFGEGVEKVDLNSAKLPSQDLPMPMRPLLQARLKAGTDTRDTDAEAARGDVRPTMGRIGYHLCPIGRAESPLAE